MMSIERSVSYHLLGYDINKWYARSRRMIGIE